MPAEGSVPVGEEWSWLQRLVLAFSTRNRARKAAVITRFMADHRLRTVLLVGAGDAGNPNKLVVEREVAAAGRIMAACDLYRPTSIDWPYVRGDGRRLPFRTGSVDIAVSNAVIEHVGDENDQRDFVREHGRVARSWVITTPNRWFPVEPHTSTVLRHFSPTWRESRAEFTRLLSLREFRRLVPPDTLVIGHAWSPTFIALFSPARDDRTPGGGSRNRATA
ncbi:MULTISPECIES: methyltransferase domain-containing protein [Pseudofrankia]|uniref:methyltransferase domain-containing protein n=1 Tax=Pseudofrankia TaxID=2994363 RepID=UPI001041F9E3|nr:MULTISPECIES: methyltransferase domain-containing protein [Pseudofrankia]